MTGYRELAESLRERIDQREFHAGDTLPKIPDLMEEYGCARQTVRDAVGELADDGLVVTIRKRGTVVRHRTPVRIPLRRYQSALTPGGRKGPWETATADQGLDGHMSLMSVEEVSADASLADLLELHPESRLCYRLRHAIIRPDDVVQLQHAWYPWQIAESAGLTTAEKIEGGIYRALTRAGHSPTSAAEAIEARRPTSDERAQLRIGGRIPVTAVERVTRDHAGTPVEVLHAVAPSDRIRLVYEDLPLAPPT